MKLKTKKVWLHVPVTIRYETEAGARKALRGIKEALDRLITLSGWDGETGYYHCRAGRPRTKMPKETQA